MKKLLAILVLGLLLSSNAYAKETYLTCESYRVVGHYKNGGVSDEPGGDVELDTVFKINTYKERIYEFNKFSNNFIEQKDVDWSEAYISWEGDYEQYITVHKINRLDSTYIIRILYNSDPTWKSVVTYSKCRVGKKKF
jgi:hypothetical protein